MDAAAVLRESGPGSWSTICPWASPKGADFYADHRAALRYAGSGPGIPIDWSFFDRELPEQIVLSHEGFLVEDPPNLNVDWPAVRDQMLPFRGYPYTSVGIALLKR